MSEAVEVVRTILVDDELGAKVAQIEDQPVHRPPPELQDKFRWIQCTMRNETQFDLGFVNTYFDAGRYWVAPAGAVPPFTQMTWSACNNDLSFATGAVGGSMFRLNLDGAHVDFALGWAAPAMGSCKAGVAESADAYDAVGMEGESFTSRRVFEGLNKDGNRAQFRIHVAATPGQEALVVIQQVPVA